MIHSTAQRKEHSKTEFEKREFQKKFEESETFYRSKFSRATGVRNVRELHHSTLILTPAHPERWGWVFNERRTRILSGIQFTTYFIEFFVVETKRFVCSFVNVTLTRQTCGQRSSRGAESKRRVTGNYLSERICYMFLISKCRGDQDLEVCTSSVLAFENPQRHGEI